MDTGNYQYSQYQSNTGYDATGNSYSAGQPQSQNMMSQQAGAQSGTMSQQPSGQSGVMSQQASGQSGMMSQQPSGQSGMMSQQSSGQSGMMSQQPGTMSQQSGTMPSQSGVMSDQTGMAQQWGSMSQQSGTMSQQSGLMSQQTGIMSQQTGTMSQQTGVMPQQSGMMSQQSGMMSQQSGMMPQQSGMMSQQSGMWNNMSGSSDVQQSQGSWMAPQQDNMAGSSVFSTGDSSSYNQQSDNYSMYQSTSNFTQAQAPDKFGGSSMQNNSGSQQYGNMSGGMMSGYDQDNYVYSQQDTSSNFNGQQSNFQGNNSQSNFQGNNNSQSNFQGTNNSQSNFQGTNNSQSNFQAINNSQSNFQGTNNSRPNFQGNNSQSNFQGNNFQSNFQGGNNSQSNFQGNNSQFQQGYNSGYNYGNASVQSGSYSSGYQQGNGGNFNKPFNYQSNNSTNNSMNSQQNMGSQYQQGSWKNPSPQQTRPSGFKQQQGVRPSFTPKKNFNDPTMNQFYKEIGGPSQQPPKKKSRFDQTSASTPTFADPQHTIGQRLNDKAMRRQTGQVFMGRGSKPQELDASLTPVVNNASEFDDEDTEHCKLCNAYFTSAPMYALHVRGLAHIQRRMAVEFGRERRHPDKPYIVSGKNYTQTVPQNENLTGFGQPWDDGGDLNEGCYCEVCDIHVDHERMLWRHCQGKKHRKAIKALEEGSGARPGPGRWETTRSEKATQLMDTPVPDDQLSAINFAFDSAPPHEPVVGLAFMVEKMENMSQVFGCQLCKTQGNLYNMVQHALGTRHRMNYLKVRDRERYQMINLLGNKKEITERARQLCVELEKVEGRGTARYNGPPRRLPQNRRGGRDATPPHEHLLKYQEQQALMSESEKKLAIESLKRTLLEDFMKRNIDPDTATKILNSRMELLSEYEKRGVPFVLARERVIEEEERWNLLLEFERQVLSFEEAEQRIDHRFELMKMYEKNGYPNEEARRKVLDDEVIYDFKRDFVRLGLKREEAQNLAEKRLWMLEQLHYQDLSPEDASEKVIAIERELKKSIKAMLEDQQHGRRRRESKPAQWMVAGEELEKYVIFSCRELSLNFDQTDEQVGIALEAFDRYRRHGGMVAIEAKVQVLANDLPLPRPSSHRGPDEPMESTNDPASKVDIKNRVLQFKSKMDEAMQASAEGSSTEDGSSPEKSEAEKEKKLAEYDQQSRVEIQTLLADMLKMKIPPDEARKILVSLYKQHETLREQFFPSKKFPSISSKGSKTEEAAASKEPQSSATGHPAEKQAASDDMPAEKSSEKSPTAEKLVVETENKSEDAQADGKTTKVTEDQKKSNEKDQSKDGPEKAQEEKKETTAVDRWESSVEMFLQQYGLTRDEYRAQAMKKRSRDKDRYSPSQLSPKRSRSRSQDRGKKRPRSRSPSRWKRMVNSETRPRSPGRDRRGPTSGGWFPSRRSRYSPGRRSPGRRYSPGPRSSSSRRSPGPRSSRSHRPGRSTSSRRSPGRRSSPDMNRPLSPLQSWGRPAEFDPSSRRRPRSRDRDNDSDRRRRPRWERGNRTPEREEAGFNFVGGVWPDVDDPWD